LSSNGTSVGPMEGWRLHVLSVLDDLFVLVMLNSSSRMYSVLAIGFRLLSSETFTGKPNRLVDREVGDLGNSGGNGRTMDYLTGAW